MAPFDAELFRQWWFEGPQHLDRLMRKTVYDQEEVQRATPSRFLEQHRRHQVLEPCASSWRDKGYNEIWLNGTNDWIYRVCT